MASECAAKHYLQAGKLKIARSYLLEARSLYAKWGAERKVTDLDEKYPYLVTRGQAAEASIDLSCVVKASQAVSNETVLQQMLDSIMRIVLENAGAEKGMLVLERDRRLWIDAEKTANAPFAAMQIMPLEDCRDAAVTVIQYAARTGETVLLQDAVLSELFSKTPTFNQTAEIDSLRPDLPIQQARRRFVPGEQPGDARVSRGKG
ncbi:hypothetical protein [Paenibacillus validus]|uniref:hypothetical protein n=1 Tax=Paenibacillus validus TaxID=44253 RepID=UPI003D2B84A9